MAAEERTLGGDPPHHCLQRPADVQAHTLYVADTSGAKDTLFGVDASCSVVRTQDISDAKVADLQAMAFAPSADSTDPAAEQSLFVADAGTATTLGRVAELTLAPVAAATPTVTGARTQTIETGSGPGGTWVPTSPDPSGITYLPVSDRLLVSDAEVDEMSIKNDGEILARYGKR